MKTEIIAETFLETALKKYTVDEAKIAELAKECMALKVVSVVDKEGYKIVKQAYAGVRSKIIEVETVRKAEKKESLDFGRAIDARAKTLTELLSPIKEHLLEQKTIVDDEELRIANEKARLAQEVIDKADAIKKKEEDDRQAKIKADQEAENTRLEGIRKEQEAKAKELQDKASEIDAENRRINEEREKERYEKKEKQRQEVAKDEAEKKAQKDAELKVKRDVEEKRIAEEQEAKDEALRVALMPDNEKLVALANAIEAIEMPALSHNDSHIVLDDVKIYLEKACKVLRQ